MIKKISFITFSILTFLVSFLFTYNFQAFAESNEKYYGDWYGGQGQVEYIHNVIDFDSCEQVTEFITIKMPAYDTTTQEYSCAPIAATIVIGYYDVTLTNLIPNFEPGYTYNNKFYFIGTSYTIIDVKEYIYELMGTNTDGPGTSVAQFKSGMKEYVNEQGYDITYSSLGSNFNLNRAREYFSDQIPVVLFLDSFEYYPTGGVTLKDDYISMVGKKCDSLHVVVAFGYQEYNFYVDNQLTRTDKYLIVAFGDGSLGYLLINDLDVINEAYAITIY